ncbi:MAG: 3-oxoacyl-ACP reductase [Dehalococcoidia bacterium]|nr:3-oxoacyl-ACP reductase [Dehalococcoidia bacterium]MQF98715.1 SDR family oxidoreductase [SAR202 cluster bacterium]|tara:strand:- start:352 stop:1110 length:759 start_codon:yes stop_codon:yes gene_type:complete
MVSNHKVALITGAGSGIGRSSSLALLKNGYSVVLAGRHIETLEETSELAGDNGKNAISVVTDVTDPGSIKALFATAKNKFGRLDVLFNNAGRGAPPVPFDELSYEQWSSVVDTNLTGSFLCAQEAFRIMKEQDPMGGRIINNGSISAHTPRPNSSPYTSTKHAITGLTKSISLDGRKYNIACSQIDIGNAGTEMTARMKNGVPQANGTTMVEPTFDVNYVADAILTISNMSLDTNVQFMTILATNMPFVGRG